MSIHLLENTVDIASTVNFRRKSVEIDRRCGFIPKKLVDRVLQRSRKKGPLTYGSIGSEKWSRTQIYQEVMVPCVVRIDLNTYPHIDTYPSIYRPGRSVTVDIDGRFRFADGRIRSISTVDADSPTENYGRSSIVD